MKLWNPRKQAARGLGCDKRLNPSLETGRRMATRRGDGATAQSPSRPPAPGCASGNQTLTVVPFPASLSINSCPRWRLTMCLTMARPRPGPSGGARPPFVHAIKSFRHARQVGTRYPRALVGHRQHHARPGRPRSAGRGEPGRQSHRAALAAVLHRVIQQILQHLGDLIGIANDRRRLRRDLHRDPRAARGQPRLISRDDPRQQRREIDQFGWRLMLRSFRSATG